MPKRRDKNKVRRVVKEYVRNGLDMSKALAVVDNRENDHYLSVKASRWRLSPEVIAEIKAEVDKFDKTLVNEQFVTYKLYEMINDAKVKDSDKAYALTLCAKILQMTRDGNTVNIAVMGNEKLATIISNVRNIDIIDPIIAQKVDISST